MAGGKWTYSGETAVIETFDCLHRIAETIALGELSPRFVSQMSEFRAAVEDLQDPEALRALYYRLLPEDAPEEVGIFGDLLLLLESTKGDDKRKIDIRWNHVEDLLLSARFLARKGAV